MLKTFFISALFIISLTYNIHFALGNNKAMYFPVGENTKEACIPKLEIEEIGELCGLERLVLIPFNNIRNDSVCKKSFGLEDSFFFVGSNLLTIKVFVKPSDEEAFIKMAELIHLNSNKGLKIEKGIAEEAISLTFEDELNQKQENQLIFRQKNILVQVQAIQLNWSNVVCPCFGVEKLKMLAAKIATSIES